MSSPASGLQFNIRLINGGLTVGITMSSIPEVGSPEGLAGVLIGELKKRNIVFGLDEEAILGIMRQRTLDEEVEIAHGVPPRSGSDAEVELLLLPPSFTAQAGEDGRVDYKNLENVSQVKAGDLVSRKTPADPGEPGVNVFGKPIRPPAVRDAKHPAGRNTVVSEDHLEMHAATDGFLRWNDDEIDVVELYAVKGDVDLRTGNVRYDKDVEVLGDVTAGFEVLAGGDVHIFGSVDGGKVVSTGGMVRIDGGVIGSEGGPAVVTAERDVHIGRARFARIESKTGRMVANFAVEHSEIHAAGDLILRSGPAMSCVVEVGGRIDVTNVSTHETAAGEARTLPVITHSSSSNRREYVRAVLSPPVKAQLPGDKPSETREAEILNISAGGTKLRLDGRLREGDRCRVQFALEGVPGTMWMEAEVARTCEPLSSDDGSASSYGLKFVRIEPTVREAIARFCLAEDLRQQRLAKTAQ